MNSKTQNIILNFCIITLLLQACIFSGNTAQAGTDALTATLSEVTGNVEVRVTAKAEFSPAQDGSILRSDGSIRTGDDGRTRVNLSTGTFFRVGPSSNFTFDTIENDADPLIKIQLTEGKIWIILSVGSMQVDTPSGIASVRGSYLYVEARPDKSVRVTCLEGDCALNNAGGNANLVAGQAAVFQDANTAPQTENMTEEDFNQWLSVNPESQEIIPAVTATQGALPSATPPPAQPFAPPVSFGPNAENFPGGFNPLSGQPVEKQEYLNYPAMLLSISHFPATARPQAGLSFAPWVFEFYITEGATRFLSVFYGQFPKPEVPIRGDCELRQGVFTQTENILGNRVWLDSNQNGMQESFEPGVGGICVNLYDEGSELIDQTTTDSNGYYGFNVDTGKYTVEFTLPDWLKFTHPNVGDENHDSDANQESGWAEAEVSSTLLYLDAGLIAIPELIPSPEEGFTFPKPEVGPIRSGRLLYADIAGFFQSSCLVYAFASEEVLDKLPKCSFVTHEDAGGGAMMPLDRMEAVALDNKNKTRSDFNYASNLFTETTPEGGVPANQINVYVALLNQSSWTYDPLYGAYLRSVDKASQETAGQLHLETDRLTGRQLHFENFIVIYAEHDVISPTNLDIHLEQGDEGDAVLFRDGKMFNIKWSTRGDDYEKQTGLRRPIQFQNLDGSPAQLKPGSSWIFVATPYSVLSDEGSGVWKLRFYAPDGSAFVNPFQ